MKIVAYVSKKVEMEVDDKFKELLKDEVNKELDDELTNLILDNDDILGLHAIWDENEEFCIGEY